jgi:hypothetical protein
MAHQVDLSGGKDPVDLAFELVCSLADVPERVDPGNHQAKSESAKVRHGPPEVVDALSFPQADLQGIIGPVDEHHRVFCEEWRSSTLFGAKEASEKPETLAVSLGLGFGIDLGRVSSAFLRQVPLQL